MESTLSWTFHRNVSTRFPNPRYNFSKVSAPRAMSYCFNAECQRPENPPETNFCLNCGGKLLLNNLFRALKPLGQGGFGRTFRAVNQGRFNEPCVIKQLSPPSDVQKQTAAMKEYVRLFNQEAQRLYELGKHPQIPELISFFEQDKQLYLVQEFIDGQNLVEELQQGTKTEVQVREILTELLPILQFIHEKGVIHRDIKPDNIMRRRDGKLILIDFGVAKEFVPNATVKSGTSLGTPGYAPMEQMRGRAVSASDIYSLGVTCICLLTGILANEAIDKLFDAMEGEWIWRKRLPSAVKVSQQFGQLLDKMLAEYLKDRYKSAAEVLAELSPQASVVPPTVIHQPAKANTASSAKLKKPLPVLKLIKKSIHQPVNPAPLAKSFGENLGNGINLEMVAIPGGTFLMGSPENEKGRRSNESPQHKVTVKPFFMGKFTITQAQWQAVVALPEVKIALNPNPSRFKGADRPVEQVSWYDAEEFCARLSRKTGKAYRLPSEAEWEYACRGGTTTPFHLGETITPKIANYSNNHQGTTPVGNFPANAFGLHDMHGNVWEWCADGWHGNYQGAPIDGTIWSSSDECRVIRGGSWTFNQRNCRSAVRGKTNPDNRGGCGFRAVCSVV
jgi:formylglycine-generating enzyme required for sulfatase activity